MEQDNRNQFTIDASAQTTGNYEKSKYEEIAKKSGILAAVKAYKDDHNCSIKEAKEKIDLWGIQGFNGGPGTGSGGCMIASILIGSTFASLLTCLLVFIV